MSIAEYQIGLKVIAHIDEVETVDAIVHELTSFAGSYGFTTVTIAQLVSPAMVNNDRIFLTDWPQEFLDRRQAENLVIRDPIVRYALRTKQPFSWQTAYDHADRAGQQMLDEARDYTQNDGILFPVYAFDQVPGCVSLGTERLDLSPTQIKLIDLVCQHSYMRVASQLGPFPYEIRAKLTNREIEVLHFAAAGKSNWEIGKILRVSEHTVHDYMKRASKKLNTSGRTHTVAMAMAQQLVMV